MKTKKSILVITIVITALLVTLCGCAESKDNVLSDVKTEKEIKTNAIEEDGEDSDSDHEAGLLIKNIGENSYKDELVNQIKLWKTLKEEDLYFYSNVEHKISEIKEFYFPTIEIEGYELFYIEVLESSFNYCYAPTEKLKKENEYISLYEGFMISIRRWEWFDEETITNPLKALVEQAEEQGWGYLTEDNMVYAKSHGDITARMDNTLITIKAPDELNTYEYLRDLAFLVIETAELIKVDEYVLPEGYKTPVKEYEEYAETKDFATEATPIYYD